MAACLGSWTLRKERLAQRRGVAWKDHSIRSHLTLSFPTIFWGYPTVPSERGCSGAGRPGWAASAGREPRDRRSATAKGWRFPLVTVSKQEAVVRGSSSFLPSTRARPGPRPPHMPRGGAWAGELGGCSEGKSKQPAQVGLGLRPGGVPSRPVGSGVAADGWTEMCGLRFRAPESSGRERQRGRSTPACHCSGRHCPSGLLPPRWAAWGDDTHRP